MLHFLFHIDECIDMIHADPIEESDVKKIKDIGLGKYDLGFIEVNNHSQVDDFILAMMPFEIDETDVKWAISQLLAEAYKLGFNQGSKGLPEHINSLEVDDNSKFSMDTLLNTEEYKEW